MVGYLGMTLRPDEKEMIGYLHSLHNRPAIGACADPQPSHLKKRCKAVARPTPVVQALPERARARGPINELFQLIHFIFEFV